ncbi:MAG: hypothetical protein IPJ22_12795 [Bacteroidetes bacterium]|nr:hypothetical protein [Bacteroidota bacterium]
MKAGDTIWVYANKHSIHEDKIVGLLREVIINDLSWELNYRGDAPLLIYHTNGDQHILQIDGDLFYPLEVNLADLENEEEVYNGFLFTMDDALSLLNILLYEDLELDNDMDDEEIEDFEQYSLDYYGEQQEAFEKIVQKVEKKEAIVEEDIIGLE